MTDPIQPSGEPYVYSVAEVEQMTPSAQAEIVTRLSQYLAQINPYVPMLPNGGGVAKAARTFAELVEKQKRAEKANAWDEGYISGLDGDAFPQANPYRSE